MTKELLSIDLYVFRRLKQTDKRKQMLQKSQYIRKIHKNQE